MNMVCRASFGFIRILTAIAEQSLEPVRLDLT